MTKRCDDPGGTSPAASEGRQPSAALIRRLRKDRDRHVAFAFAAADLLIEVGSDDIVVAAAGAGHALLGIDLDDLIGRPIVDFVTTPDQPLARRLLKHVATQYRLDPALIRLAHADGTANGVLLGLCRLPDRGDAKFLSMALVPKALAPIARPRDEATGLLTSDSLHAAAQRLTHDDAAGAQQLQLVQLDGLSGVARQLPADQAAMLMQEIGAALRAASVGDVAGRLGDDAFGLVAKVGRDSNRDAVLAAELADAIREAGIADGQIQSSVAGIDLPVGGLSNTDVGQALTYAMNSFARSAGDDFNIHTLQAGLVQVLNRTVARVAETRRMLTDERLSLVYQPVVDLTTRTIHHYEALLRFPDGASTFETVVFTEDTGLIMDLDLIVCRQAIEALKRSVDASVAVNMSGRSIQNDSFRHALIELTGSLGALRNRLLFELTESSEIADMTEAELFLARLRRAGHAVCLDDFGAGATAYNYLRRFDVDFLKIDGPFLKAAGGRGRERALIRSICTLCGEIGCKVIGEMIEDEDAAFLSASLGIELGQGWLFGKPLEALPRSLGRKGAIETWK